MDKTVTQMTTEELCAEIERLDAADFNHGYRTLAVEAARKLREMQAGTALLREMMGLSVTE